MIMNSLKGYSCLDGNDDRRYRICVDQSADQSRQLRSIQLEMENLQRQLQTASYDRENAIQENRRIQDDLAATTCEVRNLQRELETSRAESFDLKRQLQTYVSEVRRAEELLTRKENERTEMLNHFRSLSLEATVLENNNHSLESEAAEARGALQTAKDQLLDLERQLADKDSLIRGYETQISELTQTVASMESQLRQQGEQKHIAEADLTAVRDLCMKLDQQKDALMQQLNDKDALKTQYDMQITKLKTEQTVIQDQMTKDRATVERLQMLLDQARQESITVQTNNQELQNEMARLRQKMSELQNKLSSESAKLRQYQTQAAEYSKQISELRRQVTNERFDRARKEEEHRRYSDSLPDSIAQTSLSNQTNNQIPNETNDAKHRYFQNETRRKCDGQTERRGVKILNPIVVECSNNSKDAQRDVPCINIMLRSDCKMHSSQYNCIQKGNTSLLQANRDSVRTDLTASNMLQFSSFDGKYDHKTVSSLKNRFDVSQSIGMHCERKYNQDNNDSIFNNISQLRYNNDPSFLHHSIQLYKIPSNNEFQSNSAKTNLFSKINGTDLEETSLLNKAAVTNLITDDNIKANFNANKIAQCPANSCKTLPKNFPATRLDDIIKQINDSNEVSKMIKADLALNLAQISKVKENSSKYLSYPVDLKSTSRNPTNLQLKSPDMLSNTEFMKSESIFKSVTYRPRKEFLYMSSLTTPDITRNVMKHSEFKNTICINKSIDEITKVTKCERSKFNKNILVTKKLKNSLIPESMDICSNANCDKINRSILNQKRDEYDNKSSSIKEHNECEDKCINTINSSLDILQNMLKDVKRFKDKAIKNSNDQNCQFKETKDKNMNCIDMNGGNKVILSKMNRDSFNSVEIIGPKCRKMLQEIKKHAETLEEQLIFINKSIKAKKKRSEKSNIKQHRDMITQNPEKKNIYIQKSYLQDNVKYCQNSLINLENNFNSQHIKGQDIILSQIDKESTCTKDHNKKDGSCGRNDAKSMCSNNISPKCIKSAQVQCARSVSFHIFDLSNFKPIAMSTPKKINSTGNDETHHYISVCTQTTCTFEGDLQTTQIEKITSTEFRNCLIKQENETANSANINKKRISSCCNEESITQTTELKSYPIEHESKTINLINTNKEQVSSCCNEKAIIIPFLTKTVSNKCLKSKYKKSEFLNFRSRSLIGPCAQCGQRLVKCKLFRRKKQQMPIIFKLMSEAYKSEDLRSNENSCDYKNCPAYKFDTQQLCRVSNLVSTVCTQSSNLKLTIATSVSHASISNPNNAKNFNKEKISRNEESCILS
ncbi:hypothetical protein QLX08_000568 [Tetragonisca angustula]|uniref:Uncharacterized protein n=1 Tax=Tetragonisca angustula TaxID=166442 RepID=A0AAW1AJG0_9HYME